MATSTYSLNYNCKLTEDYMHAASILAASGATQPLACFLNSQNQSEALLIADNGSSTELCHVFREPLSSSGWNFVGIGAQVSSILAANSSSVWMIDNDATIWMTNAGHWNPIQTLPGGDQNVAIDTNGTIYATCDVDGTWTQYTFDPVAGQFGTGTAVNYSTPPVGSSGNHWVISGGEVLTTNGSPIPGAYMPFEAPLSQGELPQQLFGTPDGTIWMLSSLGNAYTPYLPNSQWMPAAAPPQIQSFAPVSITLYYTLCGPMGSDPGPFTLYSCNGSGVNTEVAQPTDRQLTAISVGLDGTLWGLDSIGTVWRLANGTWVRLIQPTGLNGYTGGQNISEVVTGRHALGNQYAFFIYNGDLFCSMFQEQSGVFGGYWTPPITVYSGGISNLGVVNDPANANLIVYGVNSSGDFVVVQNSGGNWIAGVTKMKQSLANTKPVFNTYNGGWILYAIIDNMLYTGAGSLDKPADGPSAIKGSPQLSTLIPFSTNPNGTETILLAALDPQNQLWGIYLAKDNFTEYSFVQLSGAAVGSSIGPVESGVGVIDSQYENGCIYARDENDMLWIIRETSVQSTLPAAFGWSQWHPLGNVCTVLGTGCTMPATGVTAPPVDLFSLDSGNELNVLSEDPTTGALTDLVMLKPAGTNEDAEYVTRYLTEITIVDQNSLPQPGFQVSVTASPAIGIWIGNSLYNVGTTAAVQLTTDQKGQITFAFFAADINTPTFSFTADNLVSPPSIYPAQDVTDYLTGSPTAFPDRPVFDAAGQTLTGAQMQSQPYWVAAPTPFVQSQDAPNAGTAASTILQVYSIPTSSSGTSGTWSVAPTTTGGGSSGFWGDLCKFGHDIDHAIRKGALKISQIAIDVEKQTITLTMELASNVNNILGEALQLVINTVEDAVSAVKSVFRYIERGIDDAINWLKSLFSWADILNTKSVLEAGLLGLMTSLESNLSDSTSPYYAGTLFNTYFDEDVKNNIKAAFNDISSIFAPGTSMQTATNAVAYPLPQSAQPMGPDALHPTSATNSQSSNGTHTNYVHNHVTNYSNNGGQLPASAMGDGTSGDDILVALFDAITNNLVNNGDFQPMETVSSLQSIFNNPKNFADVAMYDIITAIEDAVLVVLDIFEGVVDALIQLAGNALAGFKNVLTATIDIPVISWLYKQISGGHPLTLLDLLCLVVSVPITIVYKLTFGLPNGTAPFTAASAQALVEQFTNNFPWPAAAGGSTTAAAPAAAPMVASVAAAPASASSGSFPFPAAGELMILNTGTYAIFDILNDLQTYDSAANGTPTSPIATFFSWASIVSTMVSQWLSAQYDIFPVQTTTAEKMTISLWALNFIPVLSGLVFTLGSSNKALAQFNTDYGMPLTYAMGSLLLLMGCGTSVEQAYDTTKKYGPLYWIQNGIAPLPTMMKPLALVGTGDNQPAGAIAAGILMACDGLFDVANGALGFVEDAI